MGVGLVLAAGTIAAAGASAYSAYSKNKADKAALDYQKNNAPHAEPYTPSLASYDPYAGILGYLGKFDKYGGALNNVSNQLNQQYQGQIDSLTPDLRFSLNKASKNTRSLVNGEIPKDVQDQIRRNTAYQSLAGGYGGSGMSRNLAKAPLDALRGRLRVGVVAQGMATNVIALLAANQVVNYLSRGKPTWENPEDDHKLDAFIPGWGGARGFFFNPFEIAAENLHQLSHYYHQRGGAMEAAQQLASNKLSPLARGAMEAVTGHDYSGRSFLSGMDRTRASLTDALPFPMPFTSLAEKDPRGAAGSGPVVGIRSLADKALSPLGYRINRQPGSVERQLIQSAGFKVTPAPSPRSRMYEIAKAYRKEQAGGDSGRPSVYPNLRRALEDDDLQGAADELRWLVKDRGLSVQKIGRALGIEKNGSLAPLYFTGSEKTDREMFRKLTPEERAVYAQAQKEHAANARKFKTLANGLRGELSASTAR